MSSAFVKEGEYENLNEIGLSPGALSFCLRREDGGEVLRQIRSFYSEKCGRHLCQMNDGLNNAIKWMIILKDC